MYYVITGILFFFPPPTIILYLLFKFCISQKRPVGLRVFVVFRIKTITYLRVTAQDQLSTGGCTLHVFIVVDKKIALHRSNFPDNYIYPFFFFVFNSS